MSSIYEAEYQRRRNQNWEGWFRESGITEVKARVHRRLSGITPPLRFLEIGCGVGDQTIEIAGLGHTVLGIDISPTAIEWASEKNTHPNCIYRVEDATSLASIPDQSIDAVWDGNCLHFLIGEDRSQSLAALFRVIATGGTLYINSVVGASGDFPGYDPVTRTQYMNGHAVTYFAEESELMDEISRAGFVIQQVEIQPGEAGISCDFAEILAIRP